jgi:AcrR family transcriptional regulator
MSKPRRTQEERSQATCAALIDAARGLFVARGYGDVSANEIVAMAGVTRGALYHHFPAGKLDLFRSVLERIEVELDRAVRDRVSSALNAPGVDPIRAAVMGLDPYFDLVSEPGVGRMLLIEAPAVLGPTGWRDIDAPWGVGQFGDLLAAFIDLGIYEAPPIAPLARMLYGAAAEAALYLAEADDKTTAREMVRDAFTRMLLGLASPSFRAGPQPAQPTGETT